MGNKEDVKNTTTDGPNDVRLDEGNPAGDVDNVAPLTPLQNDNNGERDILKDDKNVTDSNDKNKLSVETDSQGGDGVPSSSQQQPVNQVGTGPNVGNGIDSDKTTENIKLENSNQSAATGKAGAAVGSGLASLGTSEEKLDASNGGISETSVTDDEDDSEEDEDKGKKLEKKLDSSAPSPVTASPVAVDNAGGSAVDGSVNGVKNLKEENQNLKNPNEPDEGLPKKNEDEQKKQNSDKKVNQQDNQDPKNDGLENVQEKINEQLVDVVKESKGENTGKGNAEEGNSGSTFHNWQELGEAKNRPIPEDIKTYGDEKTPDGQPKLVDPFKAAYKRIIEARNGKFYEAVVLARDMEKNGKNPSFKEDGKEKGIRGKLKRVAKKVGRAFDSSKYNKVADVAKLGGAASGALSTLDSSYGNSFVAKGISLVSNFMAFVTGIREFVKKCKKFGDYKKETSKAGKVTSIVFSVIGLITDGCTILAKGASLVKNIVSFAGTPDPGGVFGKIWDRVTLLFNGLSQIGTMITASKGLQKSVDGLKKVKGLEKNRRPEIAEIVEKYKPQSFGTENKDDKEDNLNGGPMNPGAEMNNQDNKEKEKNKKQVGSDIDIASNKKKEKEKAVHKKAKEGMKDIEEGKNNDGNAEEEIEKQGDEVKSESSLDNGKGDENTKLEQSGNSNEETNTGKKEKRRTLNEVIRQAVQGKKDRHEMQKAAMRLLHRSDVSEEDKDALAAYLAVCRRKEKTSNGLINTAVGLLATIVGFGSSIASSVNYNTTPDENGDTGSAGQAAKYMGLAASLGGVAATSTKMLSDSHNKNKMASEETEIIQERLWNMFEGIKDEKKYGLKRVEDSLETCRVAEETNNVVDQIEQEKEEKEGEGEKEKEEKKEKKEEEKKMGKSKDEVIANAVEVASKYETASKHFTSAGVDYENLQKAPNLWAFKKTLIAGI